MVRDYQAAREAAEVARETATGGHPTETREHAPLITFKAYLLALAGGVMPDP